MRQTWTTTADLRAQVQRRWDKGELLGALVAPPGEIFPLRLNLRVPTSSELSERFDEVRVWAAELKRGLGASCRLVTREVRHRVIGTNSLPGEVWIDTVDDALRFLGKLREARAFEALWSTTRQQQPGLLAWLQAVPLRALALADIWPQLLSFVTWLQAHPRPGIYLRQVDLPGVDSKFIETHRAVLAELLDQVLPTEAVDTTVGGVAQFARRYGFLDKPARVRFRLLDPAHAAWVPGTDADYTVSQAAFAGLAPAARRVFITENEINFLAFPPAPDSMVVWGAGYGFDALAQAVWLKDSELHYWGDIDTHGFAILDQFRAHFPQARSFLMDRNTLLAHQGQWVSEPQPTQRDLPRLNEVERRLYDDLRWRRLREEPLRLEQERIAFGCVERAVVAVLTTAAV